MRRFPVFFLCLAGLVAASAALGQDAGPARSPWPSFRGPAASGVADGERAPTEWNAETGHNIAWSVEVPGLGHSSPVVWGNRIFVTSAVSDDPDPVFRYGTDGRIDRRTDRERNRWFVHAVDRDAGAFLWSREVTAGVPVIQRHPKNSYASATPATDGEVVVVLVATGGLSAFDIDGNLQWEVELGPINAGASYDDSYEWAAASSPVLWEDLVLVLADQQEGSFLAAFDKATGEEAWRVERDLISSFGTPTVHSEAGRTQVITNGAGTMHGYDVRTGAELWRMSGSSFNTTPTPIVSDGLIYLTSGYRFRPIFAIRADAEGDISLAEGTTSNAHVAWSSPRYGPYMSSPLAYRGLLYVVSTGGVLTAFEADTGERVYRQRIARRGGAYTASPVAADGRIYLASEDGDIFVVRAGREYELLAQNPMGGVTLSTPAISDGQFLIRTTDRLVAAVEGAAGTAAGPLAGSGTDPFPEALGPGAALELDDFEDGDLFSNTGVRWQTFTNGVSRVGLSLVEGGAAGSATAVRVEGELIAGAERGPLAQMYQPFDRGAAPVRLADLGGVRLHARGSRPFQLTIRCGGVEYGSEIDVTEAWRPVELGSDRLGPIGAPDADAWSGEACGGFYLSRRGEDELGPFWFEVDGITFFGAEAWESRER